MIKILYLIDKIKTAGAQKHVLEVIANLDKNLFDCKIITLEELCIKKIYSLSGIIGFFKLVNLIKKEKFDIVHSYLFSENILGSIAAKIANCPVIITSRRDTGMLCQGEKQHILAYRLTNRWVDKIICVSEAVKKAVLAKEKVDPAKTEVIYNGVDIRRFGELAGQRVSGLKKTFGIDDGDSVIGMVANFSWIKGHKDFIEAAQMVLEKLPNTKFILVGDGALLNGLRSTVYGRQLEDKVLFFGTRKDIPELLSIMDVSVNASYSEGMSNSILQSMASGVPVVATAVDGNLETVVDGVTGILVPPKNPKAMSEAIIRILKDKELTKKMGENARNLVKGKFSSEIMIRNMENLYKRLLKPKMAFVLSQFPETHETFILREFKALREKRIEFEIFSLKPCKDKVIHPEAVKLIEETKYCRVYSSKFIVYSLLHPLKTINSFLYVIKSYFRNPKELIKAIYVWLECFYIVEIIKKKRIKHIHSHWATMPTTTAVILNKLTGISFSFTAHAWDIFMNSNGLVGKIKKAKFVVTCTDYNRRYLSELMKNRVSNKIYLNYHGIDLNKLNYEPRTLNSELLRILAIGRLVEQKGFEYLIKACGILQNKGIDFQCSIVGSGPIEEALKSQTNTLNLQDRVKFLQTKTQIEIKNLFNQSTIFVQPSVIAKNNDRDGIPNVILESLAYGIPVVATDVSGIPEAVIHGKTGILVNQRDADGLADAIEKAWKNQQLRETLALNGRKLAEEKFNINTNITQLINIFETNGILS